MEDREKGESEGISDAAVQYEEERQRDGHVAYWDGMYVAGRHVTHY